MKYIASILTKSAYGAYVGKILNLRTPQLKVVMKVYETQKIIGKHYSLLTDTS